VNTPDDRNALFLYRQRPERHPHQHLQIMTVPSTCWAAAQPAHLHCWTAPVPQVIKDFVNLTEHVDFFLWLFSGKAPGRV
jgi:hypothetical protein